MAALIVSLQPVLVSLFAAKYLNEPLKARAILGLILGLIGLFVVVLPRINMTGANAISFVAVGASVIGLLGGTSGTILQKKYGGAIPTIAGTSIQYAATAVVLLIMALIFEEPDIQWTANFVGALAWLIFALSFGAILLLFFLLKSGSAASVSSLITVIGVWLVVSKQKDSPSAS